MRRRHDGLLIIIIALVATLLIGVYIGLSGNYELTTYEDGSFVLFEHGKRIGTGCLDHEPCED